MLPCRATQIKTYSWDNAQVLLVGNKCDMEDERVVAAERGRQLSEQLGTSAHSLRRAQRGGGVDRRGAGGLGRFMVLSCLYSMARRYVLVQFSEADKKNGRARKEIYLLCVSITLVILLVNFVTLVIKLVNFKCSYTLGYIATLFLSPVYALQCTVLLCMQ